MQLTIQSPPLACIFRDLPTVFHPHRILGIPLYVSPLYLAILQQIHCIPLYPTPTGVSTAVSVYI